MNQPYILFVDDDPDEIDIAMELFRESGMEDHMQSARSGMDALAFLEQAHASSTLPAMLVLDINMPRMDGMETLRAIKDANKFHSVQVYMHSTAADQATEAVCLLLGATGFIRKGMDNEGMRKLVMLIQEMV